MITLGIGIGKRLWRWVCAHRFLLATVALTSDTGKTLAMKFHAAIEGERSTLEALQEFEESLSGRAETLAAWQAHVRRWEKTGDVDNPYEGSTKKGECHLHELKWLLRYS